MFGSVIIRGHSWHFRSFTGYDMAFLLLMSLGWLYIYQGHLSAIEIMNEVDGGILQLSTKLFTELMRLEISDLIRFENP